MLTVVFSREEFGDLYSKENQSLNELTEVEQELDAINDAIGKNEKELGKSESYLHRVQRYKHILVSEQSTAENTEKQNLQLQINNLSDELAALEGSFDSLAGEETQRQRYEEVTTDSKLRLEFADTRSTFYL